MLKTKIKILGLILTILVVSIGFIQTTSADTPPGFSFCTENSTLSANTQLCKGGNWVLCDNSQNGQKSTDGLLVCNGSTGKWIDVSSTPPGFSFCTENSTLSANTQVCKGGNWVTCDSSQNGQKSTDQTLVCTASTGKWAAPADNPPPPNSCTTNGQVSSDSSKICQSNLWVLCSSSNDGDSISGKQCSSGKWVTPSGGGGGGGSGSTSCLSGNTKNSDSQICQSNSWVTCSSSKEGTTISGKKCTSLKWVIPGNPQTPTAQITKVTVLPASFNPAIDSTKISYTTSADAVIDVKITDSIGQVVGTLVDSKAIAAGSYFVNWYGTIGNTQGGTVLHSGTYHYKITAKNAKTNIVEDSKEGDVSLLFAAQDNGQIIVDQGQTNTQTPAEIAAQAAATLALQNAQKGKTAKTGPDVLIYGLLPVAGYFISRRKK